MRSVTDKRRYAAHDCIYSTVFGRCLFHSISPEKKSDTLGHFDDGRLRLISAFLAFFLPSTWMSSKYLIFQNLIFWSCEQEAMNCPSQEMSSDSTDSWCWPTTPRWRCGNRCVALETKNNGMMKRVFFTFLHFAFPAILYIFVGSQPNAHKSSVTHILTDFTFTQLHIFVKFTLHFPSPDMEMTGKTEFCKRLYNMTSGVLTNFFRRGGVQQIQLRTEERENGIWGR